VNKNQGQNIAFPSANGRSKLPMAELKSQDHLPQKRDRVPKMSPF